MTVSQQEPFDYRDFLKNLTGRPGVYRMLDSDATVIYVGKAKNLKKRVSSYFSRSLNDRIQKMVAQIQSIDIAVTHTEVEALILENNLIKQYSPKYNVLLKDDKTYPYIHMRTELDYPAITFYRGQRKKDGRYFGPYPSSRSVRETLHLLQKIFLLRQCEDSVYANRSRPCLQYQIKRCSAPCVEKISREDYAEDVLATSEFLQGKTSKVIDDLVTKMDTAAEALEYEQAARHRDKIIALRHILEKQYVSGEKGDMDIIAIAVEQNLSCVQVFMIRGGRNLGNKTYYPKLTAAKQPLNEQMPEIMSAFLSQYYSNIDMPAEILVNVQPDEKTILEDAFSQKMNRKTRILYRVKQDRKHWLRMAEQNANLALKSRLAAKQTVMHRMQALTEVLGLEEIPNRMECFDISHISGQQTVASCVVFGQQGAKKSDYRKFNIDGITGGDDYAAMKQALERRYSRLLKEDRVMPDILFIDGGKGQLSMAIEVLETLSINNVLLVGIAKGPDRRPGMEQLFLNGDDSPIILASNSPALHLIQQIRDEAHRFAITGHRNRRAKVKKTSVLEDIPGIGSKRRQRLLKQFGGLQAIQKAGVEDLSQIEGISEKLAQQIYDVFHPQD